MKFITALALTLLMTVSAIAQINLEDSTVRIYGYWNLHDKMSYQATINKYELKPVDSTRKDTLNFETMSYKFDVEIIDSSVNSYTIRWTNYDFKSDKVTDAAMIFNSITKNLTIDYKTDELGVFREVINWKEIRDITNKKLTEYSNQSKSTDITDQIVNSFRGMFDSKESIQAGAITDIQLLHHFHGASMRMDTMYSFPQKFANLLGGDPFDAVTNVWIDSVDTTDYTTTLRSYSAIDEIQLTNATFQYLRKLAQKMNTTPPTIDQMPVFKNESYVYGVIHDSGWVTYIDKHKEITAEGSIRCDDLILELL